MVVDPIASVKEFLDRLAQRDLRRVALIAFGIGVVLQVSVALIVLNSGGGTGSSGGVISPPASQQPAVATPTVLADRTTCAQITGTQYRSETERQWYLANCTAH